ncbi:hypothetical protein H6G89_27055 [Oscillatoria sp. FACHB-1407]|uniref:DUF5691 domain-containing protein n=1 Tax=Oscillatoria sp. FACHB-1407 TaxID=2692847 RepID=UPI001686B2BA|nr:DUF5691 domain-containing protein [Oscillatoria sp. FACHB-1407]MBD2464669.1 hypothetical protein [Oscillatoria sp. FACHB-1407]
MGLDDPWQQVVSAALLGTERQPFTVPMVSGKVGQLLTQVSHLSPEAALLTTAAILSLHRQAGWLPRTYPVVAQKPYQDDDLPRCSPRAACLLQQMLQGQYTQVLPEWLAIASKQRQRVPELYLPELLDAGRQQRDLRAAILLVLGQRGRWLAAQNPDWSYAVEVATEEDWETGSTAARLLYLQDLRSHQPDRARELLQGTWSQESAGDRAKFLEILRIELSMADEPFLEEKLGDRSKEVRRVAADLLANLPDSRLCQRMTERINALIPAKAHQDGIQIELPASCDTEMLRDGVGQSTPNRNLGEKANWLLQMIAGVPLRFWQQTFCQTPTELVKAAALSEWKTVLLDGWAQAARRHGDRDWAAAILNYSGKSARGQVCVEVLSEEQLEAVVIHELQSDPGQLNQLLWILQRHQNPWSVELAREVMHGLSNLVPETTVLWQLRSALEEFALRIPPELITEATDLRTTFEDNTILNSAIHHFLALLQFRYDMRQAFEQPSSVGHSIPQGAH